jgi:hypothetical protein
MPDPLAIMGLNDALVDIQDAQNNGKPELEILGVILAGVDGRRTRLASALTAYVEKAFRFENNVSAKFRTTISRSVVIHETQKLGKTVFETHPDYKICRQYRKLAREIEARLGMTPQSRAKSPDQVAQGDEDEANGQTNLSCPFGAPVPMKMGRLGGLLTWPAVYFQRNPTRATRLPPRQGATRSLGTEPTTPSPRVRRVSRDRCRPARPHPSPEAGAPRAIGRAAAGDF